MQIYVRITCMFDTKMSSSGSLILPKINFSNLLAIGLNFIINCRRVSKSIITIFESEPNEHLGHRFSKTSQWNQKLYSKIWKNFISNLIVIGRRKCYRALEWAAIDEVRPKWRENWLASLKRHVTCEPIVRRP